MFEDYIKYGKLSDRELSIVLKDTEKYKNKTVAATMGNLNEKKNW
jgi:hypothetical protein